MAAPRPARSGATAPAPAAGRGFRVVMRPGAGLGFRLAGGTVVDVPPGDEAARFRDLLSDPALGVLAVDEEVLMAVPDPLLRRAASRGLPVLLPFSLPRRVAEAGRGREYVAALVRRAIGYHIRIEREGGP
jgi:V/A-type H+-transporting ATPase subunit F